jgi:bifunctional enzyme CysN/CysC
MDTSEAGLETRPSGELVRIATSGSVDDGKATLIGRLLYDSKAVLADQLDAVMDASRRRNGEDGRIDLSLLTDGLRAEREQGITIDVAYRYFATPQRAFIIADTPGHELYTRNMVTGASTADVAIVLIDARKGVVEQTRRHTFVATLLGVQHLVVAVNKMDLVDWDEGVYSRITDELSNFAAKLDVGDVTSIPVSALHGDNVVARSERMPWYEGTPLLYYLDHVHIASDRNLIDPRLPVQWVIRPGGDDQLDYRGYAGKLAGGVWRTGDEVVVLPSEARSRVASVETHDGPLEEAFPPMSVVVRLEDDLAVSRGEMLCRPQNRPHVGREIDAIVCWMDQAPATKGARYALKHTTRSTQCVVSDVRHRVDVDTLHRDESAASLGLNEIGRLMLRTSAPLLFDSYRRNRATGSFILIDETTNDTVAAGMILGPRQAPAVEPTEAGSRSANVVWEGGGLDRSERADALGHGGATVWLTGLPASGKSTLAAALERELVFSGRIAYRLDGDNLRHGLNGDLGFGPADRTENVRRTAHAAQLLADAGVIVVAALVSPYVADRASARQIHTDQGLPFVEVFLDTPLELCEERDPKRLYARARAGELTGMTGVDDPYEPPTDPEVTVRPASTEEQARAVMRVLRELGVVRDQRPPRR